MIELRGVRKVYGTGDARVDALGGVDLSIARGEFLAIVGPSGSGKSTLMNVLGCLDRPTDGSYGLVGEDVATLDDDSLARVRNRTIGFVFQSFNLLARRDALDNVALPLVYAGVPPEERMARARAALARVGLADRMHHRPNELSGGQCQRVAIARAVVGRPPLILADEPTGNLDSASGREVVALLRALHREERTTVVIVTHDPALAANADRVVRMFDGLVVHDGPPGSDPGAPARD